MVRAKRNLVFLLSPLLAGFLFSCSTDGCDDERYKAVLEQANLCGDGTGEPGRITTDAKDKVLWNDGKGDAGYSPSLVRYPFSGNKQRVAVAFQEQGTDTTGAVIRIMNVTWDFSAETADAATIVEDVVVVESETDIGSYLSMSLLPKSQTLVLLYFDDQLGQIKAVFENSDGTWSDPIVVDTLSSVVGRFVDTAIDSQADILYASYIDSGNNNLRYAVIQNGAVVQGGSGAQAIVDRGRNDADNAGSGSINGKTAIAVDAFGDPTITYHDDIAGQMRIAVYNTTTQSWNIEVLGEPVTILVTPDNQGRVTLDNFVALPEQITVIADGVETTDKVDLVTSTQIEIANYDPAIEYQIRFTRPLSANYGQWSSIEYDSQGVAHICFYDFARSILRYGSNVDLKNGEAWQFDIADSAGSVGDTCDISLRDADGVFSPVISYYDGFNADLRVASRANGVWSSGRLTGAEWTGLESSIAAGDDGEVYIGYRKFDFTVQQSQLAVVRLFPEALNQQ